MAIIPILALSVVSAYSVLKFKDQLSSMYFGVVNNQAILQKSDHQLQSSKINILQFINLQENDSQDKQQKIRATLEELQSNSDTFVATFGGYKNVSGAFPNQDRSLLNGKKLDQAIVDEQKLIAQVDNEWNDYHGKAEDLIILSEDPNFKQIALNKATQALVAFEALDNSFQELTALNLDIGEISYETSNDVVHLAYFYIGIAASISAGSATAAAILVSRRVILGDLVKRTKIEMVETTIRDLLGDGADLILQFFMKELKIEKKAEPPEQEKKT